MNEETFYRDEDFKDIQVADGKDILLEYEEGAEVRCAEVSFRGKIPSEWEDFGQEPNEENNWIALSTEEKQAKTAQLAEAIQKGNIHTFLFSFEPWGEGHWLYGEFANGWAALSYEDSDNDVYYHPYNSDYQTVEILAPVEIGGQSPVPKMFALEDMELAAEITAYFLEHGQLKPGTKWIVG